MEEPMINEVDDIIYQIEKYVVPSDNSKIDLLLKLYDKIDLLDNEDPNKLKLLKYFNTESQKVYPKKKDMTFEERRTYEYLIAHKYIYDGIYLYNMIFDSYKKLNIAEIKSNAKSALCNFEIAIGVMCRYDNYEEFKNRFLYGMDKYVDDLNKILEC